MEGIMIKVFLVEDEVVVREGMKKNVDWEAHGFNLVGEASDGELAYPLIQELKPDIIITDIKMPFMDGLELSKLVVKSLPEAKIIILSGYDEFAYAKEAITIGITEYILKPITSKRLLEVLDRIKEVILKEREEKAKALINKQLYMQDQKIIREKFFRELVSGTLSTVLLIERGKELDIELHAQSYAVLLVQLDYDEGNAMYGEISERLERSLEGRKECTFFQRDLMGWAFLLKTNSEQLEEVKKRYKEEISSLLKAFGVTYVLGEGKSVLRLSALKEAFDTAHKDLMGKSVSKNYQVTMDEAINIDEGIQMKGGTMDIQQFLLKGVPGEIKDFISHFMLESETSMESLLYRQYIALDTYIHIAKFVEQLGYSLTSVLQERGKMKALHLIIQSKETTRDYITELIDLALKLRDQMAGNKYSKLIESAKAYMDQHFSEEEISLQAVADYVNMSTSHFSTIFSQETGQTFISYLTAIRMERAKELLRCSPMKSLEIGYAVGYKDPHYFSALFKRTQKCTPKEYRARAKKND